MRKLVKHFKFVPFDVVIYSMSKSNISTYADIGFQLQHERVSSTKVEYYIMDDDLKIHSSFVFSHVRLLKLIKKSGYTIGDCITKPDYRGKSIYPFVLNNIARRIITENDKEEVFIIINSNNQSSIRGVEKGGFKLIAKISGIRFLLFYFNVQKQLFN